MSEKDNFWAEWAQAMLDARLQRERDFVDRMSSVWPLGSSSSEQPLSFVDRMLALFHPGGSSPGANQGGKAEGLS